MVASLRVERGDHRQGELQWRATLGATVRAGPSGRRAGCSDGWAQHTQRGGRASASPWTHVTMKGREAGPPSRPVVMARATTATTDERMDP